VRFQRRSLKIHGKNNTEATTQFEAKVVKLKKQEITQE
jgi:hypothetical protein